MKSVERDFLSKAAALDLVRGLLRENPLAFYGLDADTREIAVVPTPRPPR